MGTHNYDNNNPKNDPTNAKVNQTRKNKGERRTPKKQNRNSLDFARLLGETNGLVRHIDDGTRLFIAVDVGELEGDFAHLLRESLIMFLGDAQIGEGALQRLLAIGDLAWADWLKTILPIQPLLNN